MEPPPNACGGGESEKFFSLVEADVVSYGDSKTLAGTYQPLLQQYLLYVDGPHITNYILAANGRTAATGAAAIDAELAASSANPGYILFNLGVTDADAWPAEATWKANIGYILDAMHTKWPRALIYMMRVWRRDYSAECNTLDGWIDAIIAARDYCRTGPDERVFLENGDNGVTYTADGIHPNAAGYALTATQWQTAIGY